MPCLVFIELLFVASQESNRCKEQLVGDYSHSVVVVLESIDDLGSHVGPIPSILVGILFLVGGTSPEVSQSGSPCSLMVIFSGFRSLWMIFLLRRWTDVAIKATMMNSR